MQLNFSKLVACIMIISCAPFSAISASQENITRAVPLHLSAAGDQAIQHRALNSDRFYNTQQQLLLSFNTDDSITVTVPLRDQNTQITVDNSVRLNPTHVAINHTFQHQNKSYQMIYTQGQNTGIGEVYSDNQHWYFEVTQAGIWLVNISDSRLLPGLYENDVVNLTDISEISPNPRMTSPSHSSIVMVDILLLYTPNIVEQYPGEMSQTLLNHIVAKANQTFVDSDIDMQLRLVGSEFVNYTKPSNFSALQDLDFAIDGNNGTTPDASLASIGNLRNQLGADIVAMIRTHDLNEREVCGVARFPDPDSDVLINISNIGISGGSNCLNTFTHEIGHNFGAGHQQNAGNSVGLLDYSGALIVAGQYNTIMSSIGTGDVNRDFKLPLFSNITNMCGGKICGDAQVADNARTMNELARQNAAIRLQTIAGTITPPAKSARDADTDGTDDSLDPFPYLNSENADSDDDGVGDNTDAFPTNASESVDTDYDGIGNNADTDDDNDGTNDTQDDLPLDSQDTIDADNDGVGQSRDALDNDFQERFDADSDGMGDRADPDDDNDGVPDYWPTPTLSQTSAIVSSAGTDQILQFSANGAFEKAVVTMPPGALSFRSDLLVAPNQQLFFIAFSDIYQLDRQRDEIRVAVDRSQLATNFPAHLAIIGNRLLIGHGLGTSYVDGFNLIASGNLLNTRTSSTDVFRDITLHSNSTVLVVSRSTNQIFSLNINRSNATPELFSAQGMERPEHMVIDSQGRVVVSNAGTRNIVRFDQQGNLLGTLISAGSGGLGHPACLTLGPDNALYVCSADTNEILKFDSDSGAFDSIFITAGEGGLSQPVSLQFISERADEFPYDPNHDSDSDGVNNPQDDFPLDPTETTDTDSDGTGNNADEDDDNDGMPDSFEVEFGLNPLDPADAGADPDGDGISNLNEYFNDTDPNVADAPPPPPPAPVPQPEPPNADSGGGSIGFYALLLLLWVSRQRMSAKRNADCADFTALRNY